MFNFIGGNVGAWRVLRMETIVGAPLEQIAGIDVIKGKFASLPKGRTWILRGATSYERYATRAEKDLLASRQPVLERPEASHAALIPIRKSAAWWNLAQDERGEILAAKSKHIQIGLKYLPAIARRLHHSRDLGTEEFDFLTWFEYAPADANKFAELLDALSETE